MSDSFYRRGVVTWLCCYKRWGGTLNNMILKHFSMFEGRTEGQYRIDW